MFYKILLIVHIICGSTALLSGLVAMLRKKNRGPHATAGLIYYYSMLMVTASSITLTIIKPNQFLFAIGVFTFYLVYSGRKYIRYYNQKQEWNLPVLDKAIMLISLVVAIYMMTQPIFLMLQFGKLIFPILSVFGLILLINCVADLRFLSNKQNRIPRNKNLLLMHIGKMGGAYIATLTAFLVNNLHLEPGWLVWMLPTFIGSPLIAISIKNWKTKLKLT